MQVSRPNRHAAYAVCGLLFLAGSPFRVATAAEPASSAPANGTAGDVPSLVVTRIGPLPATWLELRDQQVSGIGTPIAVERLMQMRGGSDTGESTVTIDGSVDGNSAEDVFSGSNHIENAFGQAAGITTVIQNSGSNVLIQSGVAVNIMFTD